MFSCVRALCLRQVSALGSWVCGHDIGSKGLTYEAIRCAFSVQAETRADSLQLESEKAREAKIFLSHF